MNKRAEILHEHVIFIVLNIVFFSVMLLFIYLQGSSVHLIEEETAKGIALLIDVAKPGTTVELNLKEFFEKAEKNGISRDKIIEIDKEKNLVIVRGSEDSFYEYGYFNDGVDNGNVDFAHGIDIDNRDYWKLVVVRIEEEVKDSEEVEKNEV